MSRNHIFATFIAFLITISCGEVYAQDGDYLLSHHAQDLEGLDNINFQIVVDSRGQLCIANRSGVLLFDGTYWDYLPTPSAVLSISLDKQDNIYVGCVGDFGRIGFKDNKYQFISLDESNDEGGLYFNTICLDSAAYFLNEDNLIEYNYDLESSRTFKVRDSISYFNNIFDFENKILAQTTEGYFQVDGDSLVSVKLPHSFQDEILILRKHPLKEAYIVVTDENKTYNMEGGKISELPSSKYTFENDIYINDIVWVNENVYAISTLENGCFLFDESKPEPIETINYNKGLPDNEILCVAVDNEHGLWLAHEFGLARVESNIPARSFSNYPGLQGNLLQSIHFDDKLYVSTSNGVYYLDSENQYKNTVYYTLKKTKSKPQSKTKVTAEKSSEQAKLIKNNKRSRVKNLFKKIGKNQKTDLQKKELASSDDKKEKKGFIGRIVKNISKLKDNQLLKIKKTNLSDSKKYERRVKSEIINTRYLYKPISGLNTKSKQFITFKDKLLVSGNSGIYEINDEEAHLVIHEPVRYVEVDQTGENLILSTYDNQVKVYEYTGNIWVENNSLDFFGEIVLSILSDDKGFTWLASADKLFRLDSLNTEQREFSEFKIPNQFIDDVKLAIISDKISIINSLGFFYLDEEKDSVVVDSATYKVIGKPVKHLQQDDGSVWVYNGKKWFRISSDGSLEPFEQLGLFSEMSFIGNSDKEIWLINDYNDLYKFDVHQYDSLVSKHKMFLKRIRNNAGHVDMSGDLVFDHYNSTLQFELSRPDYLGLLKVEYQYKLEGLNSNWSAWNTSNKIDFSYLPANKYSLIVRSRDSFGNIQESSPFEFRIKPPYWQTIWFYALQITLMSVLVIGSARMNRKAEKKYVLLTEALTILTIVLIIEFLQTIAQNYFGVQTSPVADFSINVLVALLVFPLEQFLKKVMRADPSVPGISGKGIFDLLAMVKKK